MLVSSANSVMKEGVTGERLDFGLTTLYLLASARVSLIIRVNPFPTILAVRLVEGFKRARTALARQGEPGEKNVPVSACRAVNKLSESVACTCMRS